MSILDKSIIKTIINKPKDVFNNYDEFDNYLNNNVQKLLNAELLSHLFIGSGSDIYCFLMFKYNDIYILLCIWEGSCDGCILSKTPYNSILDEAIDTCYITSSLDDIETYYLKRIKNIEYDTDFQKKEHLYYLDPNWPF